MGSGMVGQVGALALHGEARWCDLSHAARLTLLVMAAHARDTPSENTPAATYFGGWERLSGHLGYPKHDGAAERATARAVAELLASGLAENVGRLQPGRGPRLYLLHLGGAWP